MFCKSPLNIFLAVSKSFQDLFDVVKKPESTVRLVMGLGSHSSTRCQWPALWKRFGSQEHTRRIVRRWIYWELLPSSGSTRSECRWRSWTWAMWKRLARSEFWSIVLPARLYFSLSLTMREERVLPCERNRICILRLCQQDVAQRAHVLSICTQTLALRYTRSVCLQYERNRICTLSSTCVISLIDVRWVRWEVASVCKHTARLRVRVHRQLFFELSLGFMDVNEFGSIASLARLYVSPCIQTLTLRFTRNHNDVMVVAPICMAWRIYLSTGSQTEIALMFRSSHISLAERPAESTTILSRATWSVTFTLARQCRVIKWHSYVLTDCWAHDESTYGPFSRWMFITETIRAKTGSNGLLRTWRKNLLTDTIHDDYPARRLRGIESGGVPPERILKEFTAPVHAPCVLPARHHQWNAGQQHDDQCAHCCLRECVLVVSRRLGLTLRPSAPVYCCHRDFLTRWRLISTRRLKQKVFMWLLKFSMLQTPFAHLRYLMELALASLSDV